MSEELEMRVIALERHLVKLQDALIKTNDVVIRLQARSLGLQDLGRMSDYERQKSDVAAD